MKLNITYTCTMIFGILMTFVQQSPSLLNEANSNTIYNQSNANPLIQSINNDLNDANKPKPTPP